MSNKSAETLTNRFDTVLWILVVAIVLGGVYANSMFIAVNVLVRALAGIALTVVAVGIALQTVNGHAAWELAKEARVEVRKVIWPTRQETTQTTMIVVGVVILVAAMLWALDSVLSWGIKSIIG